MTHWQDISIAPKDGRFILAYDAETPYHNWTEEVYMLVKWDGDTWRIALDGQSAQPTHWQELPPPPAKS